MRRGNCVKIKIDRGPRFQTRRTQEHVHVCVHVFVRARSVVPRGCVKSPAQSWFTVVHPDTKPHPSWCYVHERAAFEPLRQLSTQHGNHHDFCRFSIRHVLILFLLASAAVGAGKSRTSLLLVSRRLALSHSRRLVVCSHSHLGAESSNCRHVDQTIHPTYCTLEHSMSVNLEVTTTAFRPHQAKR